MQQNAAHAQWERADFIALVHHVVVRTHGFKYLQRDSRKIYFMCNGKVHHPPRGEKSRLNSVRTLKDTVKTFLANYSYSREIVSLPFLKKTDWFSSLFRSPDGNFKWQLKRWTLRNGTDSNIIAFAPNDLNHHHHHPRHHHLLRWIQTDVGATLTEQQVCETNEGSNGEPELDKTYAH